MLCVARYGSAPTPGAAAAAGLIQPLHIDDASKTLWDPVLLWAGWRSKHPTGQNPHGSPARPGHCHPGRRAAAAGKSLGAGRRGGHLEQKQKKYLATALFALVISHPALACETASLDIVFVTINSSKTLPAVLTVAQNSCSDFSSRGVRRCQLLCTSVTISTVWCRTGILTHKSSQSLTLLSRNQCNSPWKLLAQSILETSLSCL